MIEVTLLVSNDAARDTRQELKKILALLGEKLSGEKRDKRDSATLCYVVLKELQTKLDMHIREIEDQERADRLRRAPTVRRTWGQ